MTIRGKYVPDPGYPGILCKKKSEPAEGDFRLSYDDLSNAWIHDVNKEEHSGNHSLSGENEWVRIYPNPSNGKFIVQVYSVANSKIPQELTMEAFHMLGQIIFSSKEFPATAFIEWKNEIDLSNSNTGVNFIEISGINNTLKSPDAFVRKKIIVAK